MKFTLDLKFDAADAGSLDAASLLQSMPTHREALLDILQVEGRIVVCFDGEEPCEPYSDPLVRLVDLWLRKLPWIIGGDTETVALRNSEQCFAFVPAAGSVEVSFFVGSEAEIEEYLIEPTTTRLEVFVTQVIGMGDTLVMIIEAVDASFLTRLEEGKDLLTSLTEAKNSWRDHLLHQRR